MKMHLHQSSQNLFTSYGDDFVAINQQQYRHPLLVTATTLQEWDVTDFDALTPDHFAALLQHQPEVVLLGTGQRQRFPHPRLWAALAEARIGFEVMTTPAVCRTFNILSSEDRKVLAVILP